MARQADMKLFLFGDQTHDVQPRLRDLLQHRDNPVLDDFLARSYDAIRTEMFSLPPRLREGLPRLTCVEDLVFSKEEGQQRCAALDMAVTCMYQIGAFISQAGPSSYDPKGSIRIGVCTGSLAVAAVSCSHNTVELVSTGVDAVKVAFRTGKHVTDTAGRVCVSSEASDGPQSWSIIVPGASAAEAVHRFCEQAKLPPTSKPYISAYAPNGITVSGPPASLDRLVSSEEFKDLHSKAIPIYGPYHAPHLYSLSDVDDIVGDVSSDKKTSSEQMIPPAFSASGHKMDVGGDFPTLLRVAVSQILLEPIRWNETLKSLRAWVEEQGPKSFSIVPIGTSADQLIYTHLRQTPLSTLLPPPAAAAGATPARGPPSAPSSNSKRPKLAIIGMSGRFPGAQDSEAFWDLLRRGLDVHKPVPELHWSARTHVDPTGRTKNTSATPFGCWLDEPAGFDARFFSISPREAPQIDPAQRLALMTAYEAIEQAGIVPDATPSTRRDRVGVFYGVTSNDWMETNSAQNIDTYFIPGGNRAFIPGRINYCFKFSGPSYAVDTACSSSLAGIHLACNSLWNRDIDTAIAGGTNVLTNPDFTSGLDKGHFLSRTGNCKTFDDTADGYCRGEGIGTIVIKRLDDAIADYDPILGVILGAYTNHSAESESITRPHSGAQRAIFSKILNQAAVDPYTVSYVEMHGTGTQAGDAGEMSSVLDTFAPAPSQVKKSRESGQALYLGSAKSNIGHGEAASGVSGLIKVLLMMQKSMIVPHCGIKTKINSKFPTDLQERNVHIALQATPWERSTDPAQPRRVFVNNFSAAGGNTALLVEDAPLCEDASLAPADADPRSHHVVALSAKSGVSLQGNLRAMLEWFKKDPDLSLGQLSYTTTARRQHWQHRVMLVGASAADMSAQITTALRDGTGMTRPKGAARVVFAFTGQGAQYPGMGRQLLEHFSLFRDEMRRLDQLATGLGFASVLPVMQADEHEDVAAFAPATVQLASVCLQIALAKLWASWDITPAAVVGHSLGEYAALNVAGVLSDADTLYLVGQRARLLEEKCVRDTHAMLVVKGSVEEIASQLKDTHYETACINSPVETVLAGLGDDIAALKEQLSKSGTRSMLLKVPYAFHSAQMDPILSEFEDLASAVIFQKANLPVVCPLDGSIVKAGEIGQLGPAYLARHCREPVNMFKALQVDSLAVDDKNIFLELGPHPAVSGMVRAVLGPRAVSVPSLQRGHSVWQVLGATLKTLYTAGAPIRWHEYQRDFKASHKVLQAPAYAWDLKDYWIQYVNDWSLRKGDPPLVMASAPTLESTTIHRVVEESGDGTQKCRIVVEADIAREDLSPLVQGHEVDGIPLCTPSVYADMALTLGTYLLKRYKPDQADRIVDVSDMTICKALILKAGATQQFLQAHGDVDWSLQTATLIFMSFDGKGKLQEHARCAVRFRDRSLQKKLQQEADSVRAKMQTLRDGIAEGTSARFNRPMVYRAIRPLARFHGDYRAIDEVILNSTTLEACSRLSFGSVKRGGQYHTHPAIIDSLTQSCGFTMNCNDSTDLDVDVFMNHGWGALQLFEPIDFEKAYTSYSRMYEGPDKLWRGDVVIFDGDKVVAFIGQVAIQCVPRRVLKVILSIEAGTKSQKKPSPLPTLTQQQPSRTSQPSAPKLEAGRPSSKGIESSKLAKALSIIAEESGLAVSDLTDATVFGDVGVDSLLGLSISARFKEELDADLDFNALFFEYPTVGDLKCFLGGADGPSPESDSTSTTSESSSGLSTPHGSASPGPSGRDTPVTLVDVDLSSGTKVDFSKALAIISEESGVAVEELTPDTNFADSGVDSLLSLVIVSRLRDELDLDIQHESLFIECPTVADLRTLLLGGEASGNNVAPIPETVEIPAPIAAAAKDTHTPQHSEAELASLEARQKAVDAYVEKYTAGFTVPAPSLTATAPRPDEKVVLVTGASGSLGGHVVLHLAQRADVKTVVCLNRENKAEPYARQHKALRDKGIRLPEALAHKLLVLQADTSRPQLGLSPADHDRLAGCVTHIVHSAWPMSAKRSLPGFESQFQVLRNLADLAAAAVGRRPAGFPVSVQMVSSVGVVGRYRLGDPAAPARIMVPEERVGIECVLPNGYGDAKWGCERMLDATLHRFPSRFRTMAVRLGQIAGSKTSGYWNPMEHFGFLVKSSQTLNALPDVDGDVFWTPVNDIAGALSDLVLADGAPHPIYHVENPVGQPWKEMNAVLADALGIPKANLIPFDEWVQRVKDAPQKNNPASTLLEFLDDNYNRMSCGGLVLDVKNTLEHSEVLRAVGPVDDDVVRKYIHIWREIGFLAHPISGGTGPVCRCSFCNKKAG